MKFTKDSLKQIITEEIESFLNEDYYMDDADEASLWVDELEKLTIKAYVSLATKILEKNADLIKTPEGAKALAARVMSKATPEGQTILGSPEVDEIRKYIYFSDKPAMIRDDMKTFQSEKEYLTKTIRALMGNIRVSIRLPDMVKLHQALYPDSPSEGEDFDPPPLKGKAYNPDAPPSLEFPAQEVESALEDFVQTDEYVPLKNTLQISPEVMNRIAQRK